MNRVQRLTSSDMQETKEDLKSQSPARFLPERDENNEMSKEMNE
jgi:hypothetical protein